MECTSRSSISSSFLIKRYDSLIKVNLTSIRKQYSSVESSNVQQTHCHFILF